MHGIGNDYLFLDALAEPSIASRPDLPDLARRMSSRHEGVGADGIIVLAAPQPSTPADLSMRILNSDGSEGGVCGNGLRCAAKFVADRGYVPVSDGGEVTIDTGPRAMRIRVRMGADGRVREATVDMGLPEFEPARVPVNVQVLKPAPVSCGGGPLREYIVGYRTASFVSVGNPHMVSFIEEPVETVDLDREGPVFERHPAFPERINVHIVNQLGRAEVRVRTWERGAGMTLACGTGATATVAAGIATGRLDRRVLVHMPGGDLVIEQDPGSGHIFKTGPAVEVFQGDWPE